MINSIMTARSYIENQTDFQPEVAIVLGSGLGNYAQTVDVVMEFDYDQIPGFPVSTAPGHAGKLLFAEKAGKKLALFCGRFHCYEGYTAAETVIPLRTILLLGAKYVLLTNAAGGINRDFQAGDIMLVTDHINLSSNNVLTGKNIDTLGVRFPDMSFAYSERMRLILSDAAKAEDIKLQHGVYAYMVGPSYETPAEINALRVLGADAVGMSTVHEAVACNHAGVEVAALSCISNLAAGVANHALTEEEVLEAGLKVSSKMTKLADGLIGKL